MRALDERVDVRELALGELSDTGARVGAAVVRAGQVADLLERQAGALCDVDDRQAVQDFLAVAPLAADALGLWQDADLFVLADAGDANAGPPGDLADGQQWFRFGCHVSRP